MQRHANIVILALFFSFSSCLLTDGLGLQPPGGVPAETVVRRAATAAAQGWYYGCESALREIERDLVSDGYIFTDSTDCSSNSVNSGDEVIALYAAAARNAAKALVPLIKEKKHAFYKESTLQFCVNNAFQQAYLRTRLFITFRTDPRVARGLGLNEGIMAESTYFGVQGTVDCAGRLEGTGRVISIGDLVW